LTAAEGAPRSRGRRSALRGFRASGLALLSKARGLSLQRFMYLISFDEIRKHRTFIFQSTTPYIIVISLNFCCVVSFLLFRVK
jgi:hypothetical protein